MRYENASDFMRLRSGIRSFIVIVYINNFYFVSRTENENCPIFQVNAETPNAQMPRLKQFGFKSRMKWVAFKKILLLFKFLRKLMANDIRLDVRMYGKNVHAPLKYRERFRPFRTLAKNFLL